MSETVSAPAPTAEHREYRRVGKTDLWICYWVMPAFYTAFGVIFVALTRVMPPPRPDRTVDEMVAFFAAHSLSIKIGFALLMVVISGAAMSNGIVAYQMRRMSVGPAFGYAYFSALAVGAIPGCLMAAFCFLAATLRPERDPQVIALLYDLGLLSFVGSLGCFTTAWMVLAFAILLDQRDIFPKWFAYVTIWQVVTEMLAAPVFVFESGPFAWNGSISFWSGTAIYGFWQVCMIVLLKKAIENHPSGERMPD